MLTREGEFISILLSLPLKTMENEITEIYDQCQNWDSKSIKRLIKILETLSEEIAEYEKEQD